MKKLINTVDTVLSESPRVMSLETAAETVAGPVASIVIDDDVAVKPSAHSTGRRGVAGTLAVERIVGAAAEQGRLLADGDHHGRGGAHALGRAGPHGNPPLGRSAPSAGLCVIFPIPSRQRAPLPPTSQQDFACDTSSTAAMRS